MFFEKIVSFEDITLDNHHLEPNLFPKSLYSVWFLFLKSRLFNPDTLITEYRLKLDLSNNKLTACFIDRFRSLFSICVANAFNPSCKLCIYIIFTFAAKHDCFSDLKLVNDITYRENIASHSWVSQQLLVIYTEIHFEM